MKNLTKLLAIIALVAIIGFSFVACDTGGGGGGNNNNNNGGGGTAKTKFKFAKGTAPSRSIARNAANLTPLASTVGDLSGYNTFYNTTLGGTGKLVRKITPTSFKLNISRLSIEGQNGELGKTLIESKIVDFSQNQVLAPEGVVLSGTYDFVAISFDAVEDTGSTFDSVTGALIETSTVQFTWPSELNGKFDTNTQLYDVSSVQGGMENKGATLNGNTITTPLGRLLPNQVRYFISPKETGTGTTYSWFGIQDSTDTTSPAQRMFLVGIYFAGDAHKLVSISGNPGDTEIKKSDFMTHADNEFNHLMGSEGGPLDAFVVPFTPVIVPEIDEDDEEAEPIFVWFEIYWNLTDLIEQYQGQDNTADTADDIFVLKNNWWTELSIRAFIE